MGRIQKAYQAKLRLLLGPVRARRIDKAIAWFLEQARRLSEQESISLTLAQSRVVARARQKLEPWKRRRAQSLAGSWSSQPLRFLCDAGLGGLARWLRAAGYEADWTRDIADDDLLKQVHESGAVLLTTDSMLMERRLIQRGEITAVWLPPTLGIREQLALVLEELQLPLREPRCMTCSGRLRRADKESLRDRIPPRTYRWLDTYFVCEKCNKLFWHGTHWQKIQRQLQNLKE